MSRYRVVPAIVPLLAGFITSVLLILNKYSLESFVWIVLLVMVCFFVASWLVVYALNRLADKMEEEQKEEENIDQDEDIPDIDLDNIDSIEGVDGKDFDYSNFGDE
jgi:formate hydrogenlyase subunit 3/multisubunit Na+/H+ antiporter MnhD subunit